LPIAHDDAGRVLVGEQKLNGNSDPVLVEPIGERAFRRSVYVQARRSAPLTVLDLFDEPIMSPNCPARQASTVAPQALMMLNDVFVAEQSREFAKRLQAESPGDIRAQIERAFRLAYGTTPTAAQTQATLNYLAEQAEQIRQRQSTQPPPKDPAKAPPIVDPQTLALASLCQSLLSANQFLYLD
jgi:hypothetical protein